MNKETIKKLFLDFLEKEGVRKQYKENVKNLHLLLGTTADDVVNVMVDEYQKYIGFGFIWEDSPEGHDFWENISDKWVDYITKKTEDGLL